MSGIASTQNSFISYGGVAKPPTSMPVVVPAAASYPLTLLPSDVGSVYALTAPGAAVVLNIPAASQVPGGYLKFVNRTAGGTLVNTVSVTSPAANIYGVAIANAAQLAGAGVAAVRFAGASVKGDYVELVSDGVNWNAAGMSAAANGITFP